jgi:hypothetical protein
MYGTLPPPQTGVGATERLRPHICLYLNILGGFVAGADYDYI